MIRNKLKIIFTSLCFVFVTNNINAQEFLKPLSGNINYVYGDLKKDVVPVDIKAQDKNKKAAAGLTIPFKEDFSYASRQSYPNQTLWSDSGTYVNTGHAIAPPSIGVATFDGLNKWGYPYTPNLLNMSQSLPADTLTSKPINLFTVGTKTLQPSDSVALTFYYQARGFGDSPEVNDTLLLDLYKPLAPVINGTVVTYGQWVTGVWYERGNTNPNTNDTIFKRGFVRIRDTAYLHDGFKFRFRNKATTAGDFDHWHLDYIYLDQGRNGIADTSYDDIAFGYVPTPFLKNYAEMPWEQYIPAERADRNSVFIRNNGDLTLNMSYESRMSFFPSGVLTYTYTGGANPALDLFRYKGWDNLAPHAAPAFNHTFAAFPDSTDFLIKHYIYRSGSLADFYPGNDTVFQRQNFRNYYAFDDGSAEAAYFVSGTGGKMAQKITVNNTDTLRALRIYFDPIGSLSLVQTYEFSINIWSVSGGAPGVVMYKDSLRYPKYLNKGFNATPEYTLRTPQVLAPGDYFIGIQQKAAAGIGIGFDRNLNHSSSLFYNSGSGWTQSAIPGSLMMRPVFGRKILPPVGIREPGLNEVTGVQASSIYPNPANELLIIKNSGNLKTSWQILNLMGQIIDENSTEETSQNINTTNLSNGVYFLILRSGNQVVQKQKVIIQH